MEEPSPENIERGERTLHAFREAESFIGHVGSRLAFISMSLVWVSTPKIRCVCSIKLEEDKIISAEAGNMSDAICSALEEAGVVRGYKLPE